MISGVMSADCDPSTIPTSPPAPSRSAGCVGGLHEACVGVTDLEEAIADFRAWGCRPGLRGHLDAAASAALYGHDSALESVQLLHGDADHGLVRLMKWQTPLNDGVGLRPNLRGIGSRWGVRVTQSVHGVLNHAERALQSGLLLALLPPQLAVIGEVSGERAAKPFRDPIVGVREMVLIQPHYRQVIFERFGYESPLYGQVEPTSLLRASQHTHAGLMVASDDERIFDFYETVLGLKRTHEERVPYANATGSRSIFGLEPGEGFHMVDFDDPRTGASLAERRSGKLKCVRFAADARIEDLRELARPGCLGYSLYTWRVGDLGLLRRTLAATPGVTGIAAATLGEILPDEFGRPSLGLRAPDGSPWVLQQAPQGWPAAP
jgi:catechol 2,3-dioxygenase-like lactoylglutathione lyase family enzyme